MGEQVRDFQPATSISSFSLPPSASQLVAFLAFQLRLVHGLRTLAATPEHSVAEHTDTEHTPTELADPELEGARA